MMIGKVISSAVKFLGRKPHVVQSTLKVATKPSVAVKWGGVRPTEPLVNNLNEWLSSSLLTPAKKVQLVDNFESLNNLLRSSNRNGGFGIGGFLGEVDDIARLGVYRQAKVTSNGLLDIIPAKASSRADSSLFLLRPVGGINESTKLTLADCPNIAEIAIDGGIGGRKILIPDPVDFTSKFINSLKNKEVINLKFPHIK